VYLGFDLQAFSNLSLFLIELRTFKIIINFYTKFCFEIRCQKFGSIVWTNIFNYTENSFNVSITWIYGKNYFQNDLNIRCFANIDKFNPFFDEIYKTGRSISWWSLVCYRDGELQTETIQANPGRVVSLRVSIDSKISYILDNDYEY
jgi:hypothetical protein